MACNKPTSWKVQFNGVLFVATLKNHNITLQSQLEVLNNVLKLT